MSLKFHLQNIPFELEHELCFRWNKAFKRRPSSAPFLSGDTYRALCDVLYDDTHLCTASDIFLGSKVFVSSRLLDDFVKYVLPEVSQNFTYKSTHNNPYYDRHQRVRSSDRDIFNAL